MDKKRIAAELTKAVFSVAQVRHGTELPEIATVAVGIYKQILVDLGN
ncbi:MAG: hypothetical protein WBX26_02025 [Candidatus Cybelea sp.]